MRPTVFIVDDDDLVRDSLSMLIGGAGYPVQSFRSGTEFLAACRPGCSGCLLLDLAMPGIGGEDVYRELRRRKIHLPVLVLTGHGDIATAVRMVKAGAEDFLQKPIEGRVLLDRVGRAMAQGSGPRGPRAEALLAGAHFDTLTPRERDVMALTVAGLSNKAVARTLGISHRTVEIHRARMMHKMGAGSIVDLVAMAPACGIAIGTGHGTAAGDER